MRPAGGGGQPIKTAQSSPSNYAGFNNPFFGAPIAFAQCPTASGMDTTTTVPIYNIPKDSSIGIDQSAVPGTAMVDADTRYGLQLHHPRFLEFIGAPESARLLNQSPSFWVDRLGQESAMTAAVNLQRDAGFMMSNLQILAQFVMLLHRMSAEMLSIGVDHVVFPVDEVDKLSVMPRAQRAAK